VSSDPRPIIKAMGIDPDAMEAAIAPITELGDIRGEMAGVELMRAMGTEMATLWVAKILELYNQAFGHDYGSIQT
jgi:hypothetical protein